MVSGSAGSGAAPWSWHQSEKSSNASRYFRRVDAASEASANKRAAATRRSRSAVRSRAASGGAVSLSDGCARCMSRLMSAVKHSVRK